MRVRSGIPWMLAIGLSAVLMLPCGLGMRAQAPGEGGGRSGFANMPRVMGEVTAVSGATVTIKDQQGESTTVVTTDNTRIMRGNSQGGGMAGMAAVKLADIKVGDGAMAMGQMDDATKTLHAAMLFATDGAVLKAYKANLGKTYIAGKITAIDLDNAKLTVERPDGVSQVIAPDENTSFKRGRPGRGGGMGSMTGGSAPAATGESITMADVKVGDGVYAQGSVKGGAFVPGDLIVSTPHVHGTPAMPNDGAAPAK
jgi:hypothetical protein